MSSIRKILVLLPLLLLSWGAKAQTELVACENEFIFLRCAYYAASPGDYSLVDTLQSVAGTDSVVRTVVHVHPAFYDTTYATIRADESHAWRGRALNKEGVYVDSLSSVVSGCDSLYLLVLTVTPIITPPDTTSGDTTIIVPPDTIPPFVADSVLADYAFGVQGTLLESSSPVLKVLANGSATYRVFDNMGLLVRSGELKAEPGMKEQAFEITLPAASGIYFLHLESTSPSPLTGQRSVRVLRIMVH